MKKSKVLSTQEIIDSNIEMSMLSIVVPKSFKIKIKSAAEKNMLSVSDFCRIAINEKLVQSQTI